MPLVIHAKAKVSGIEPSDDPLFKSAGTGLIS